MPERREDHVRTVLEEFDARLVEAERLRRHAEERRAPFWPERRRVERVPDVESLRNHRSR
jgi:hypothetical protein